MPKTNESALMAEIDNKDAEISSLKSQNETYVKEINRLTAVLKDTSSKLLAYQIVMSDILKRN